MEAQRQSIFNEHALKKLRSPDDLDKMVSVTKPSAWIVLTALFSFLVSILVWGVFGSLYVNVSTSGVVRDGKALCFLATEEGLRIEMGDDAMVDGKQASVANVSKVPLSVEEAHQVLESDYLVHTLMPDDWAYEVSLEGDFSKLPDGVPVSVEITTERVAPISLVLGR